jgi:hypothetical protein
MLRERRVDRIREALESVDTGYQYVLHTTVLELCQHVETELGTFVLRDPQA